MTHDPKTLHGSPLANPRGVVVAERILNDCCIGVTLNDAADGALIALLELVRAGANGNVDSAAIMVIGNVLRYYADHPQPAVQGLVIGERLNAGGTIQ